MKCRICEKGCIIPEGSTGACGLYENRGKEITEKFPDRYLVACPISIETMPMLHFYPGQKFLQISTIGCNFDCPGCVSTSIVKEMDSESKALKKLTPDEIVKKASDNNCIGIAFLMNDPIASFQTFCKLAEVAKSKGLLVGCSSNAYFTEDSLDKISGYMDFINIGFKGMSNAAYRSCGGTTVEPVIRNLKILYERGIHIEVSCMHNNNNKEELLELGKRVGSISRDIPVQIMRFIPLEGAECSLEPSIKDSEELQKQLRMSLDYVYLFNSPGTDCLNTYCPECGKIIYKRDFYGPMGAKLRPAEDSLSVSDNICPECGFALSIKGLSAERKYQEGSFQGGYPFTRALEMIEAILITIGVNDKKEIVKAWEDVLCNSKLESLHVNIQNLNSYIDTIRSFGKITDHEKEAEELAIYIEKKLLSVREGLSKLAVKPRVYYAMGKPLFCIKGERMENQLVEAAGGICVNKEIDCSGRPGMKISVEQLNELNPDVIFISAFISNSVEDFYEECIKMGIEVDAVKNRRIYTHLAPGWDFGSPRWILGLMYIANILHKDTFKFNVYEEAQKFYLKFYDMEFSLNEINRSFAKPSSRWALTE